MSVRETGSLQPCFAGVAGLTEGYEEGGGVRKGDGEGGGGGTVASRAVLGRWADGSGMYGGWKMGGGGLKEEEGKTGVGVGR